MSPLDVINGGARWSMTCGDNADVLPRLPDGSVAHVITDPPYDAKTHKYARTSETDFGIHFAPLEEPAALANTLCGLASRWVVAFCAVEQIGDYARGAGGRWVRAGVWDKIAPSPQLTGDRPGQAVEGIAIMHRAGRKHWNRGGGAGIWRFLPSHGADRPDHPTPKPVDLMLALISDFTDPGDIVLDPFAGSGTTGVACLRLGRRFIGCELDPRYAAIATERLQAEERGLSLREARAGQTTFADLLGAK